MQGYVQFPNRNQQDGVFDKLALMEAGVDRLVEDRQFGELVDDVVRTAGNAADAQAAKWARYVMSLQYKREYGELYREPMRVAAGRGGDCDDQVVPLVAGIRYLGVPCLVEILADEDGWGFHVRARVGLPPTNPTIWEVIDPVWRSEAQWAMAGRSPSDNAVAALGKGQPAAPTSWSVVPVGTGSAEFPSSSTPSWWTSPWPWLLTAGVVLWWTSKSSSPSRASKR